MLLLLVSPQLDCKSMKAKTVWLLKFLPRLKWLVSGRCSLNIGGLELSTHGTRSTPCFRRPSPDPPQLKCCFYLDSKHTTVARLALAGGAWATFLSVFRWFFFPLSQEGLTFHWRDHKSRNKLGLELGTWIWIPVLPFIFSRTPSNKYLKLSVFQ